MPFVEKMDNDAELLDEEVQVEAEGEPRFTGCSPPSSARSWPERCAGAAMPGGRKS